MKKKIMIITAALAMTIGSVTAATYTYDRTTVFGGNSIDRFAKTIQTKDNGYISIGYTLSKDIPELPNVTDADAIIVKYNSKHEIQWAKSINGFATDMWFDVIEVSDGYVTVGCTTSFSKETLTDAIVCKYDFSGDLVKTNNIIYNGYDKFNSVIEVEDGYIVTGTTSSTNIPNITNKGDIDILIVKYDKEFTELWKKTYGTEKEDPIFKIIKNNEGFLVAGYTSGKNFEGEILNGTTNTALVKIDKDGNKKWAKFGTGNASDKITGIVEDKDGGYVLVSEIASTDLPGIVVKGQTDILVEKYNANNERVWFKTFGGTKSELMATIQVAEDGYLFTMVSTSNDLENINKTDNVYSGIMYLLDESGNTLWSDLYTGTSLTCIDMLSTKKDGFIISGYINTGTYKDVVVTTSQAFFAEYNIDKYEINKSAIQNGDIEVVEKEVGGRKVTLNPVADRGYKLKSLKVINDVTKEEIVVTENKFVMPENTVTIEAEFEVIYEDKIIENKEKDVTVSGNMTIDTKVNVTKLDEETEEYKKLTEKIEENEEILRTYEVEIKDGEIKGKTEISFNIDEKYNGKKVIVSYLDEAGNLKKEKVEVKDGKATVEFASISDASNIVIMAYNEKIVENPNTSASILGGISLITISGFIAKRQKNKMNKKINR